MIMVHKSGLTLLEKCLNLVVGFWEFLVWSVCWHCTVC